MKKLIYILIILFCFVSVSYAITPDATVCSSGCDYTSIATAVSTESAGAIIEVQDGTYQESVTVDKALAIYSQTYHGAIMDGNSGALARAFIVTANNVKIVGFTIQNYELTTAETGVVHSYGYSGTEVKYNLFTGNNILASRNNTGMVYLRNGTDIILRGNIFQSNTSDGAIDECSALITQAVGVIVELNYFNDSNANFNYDLYVRYWSNGAYIQYNYFKYKRNRLRQSSNFHVLNNIFDVNGGYLQLHDQCPEDLPSDSHTVDHNTFANASYGIELSRQDNDTISNNLFLSLTTGIIDLDEGICTTTGISITNNRHYNVTNWLTNFDISEYTESGTTTTNPSYSSTDGSCGGAGTACNPGADLKINVFPYTTQAGGALQSDYSSYGYGGADTTKPTVTSASIENSPTDGKTSVINFSENVDTSSYVNGDFQVVCSVSGTVDLESISGSGSQRTLTAASFIAQGESCTLTYSGSGIEDLSSNVMDTFSGTSVTNNSTYGSSESDPPAVSSVSVVTVGPCSPTQEIQHSVNVVTDATTPGLICGVLFTHSTGAGDPADYGGESSFTSAWPAVSDPTHYATLSPDDGIGASGTTFRLSQYLACGITRYYSYVCWDTLGNKTTFGASFRDSVTTDSGTKGKNISIGKQIDLGSGVTLDIGQ